MARACVVLKTGSLNGLNERISISKDQWLLDSRYGKHESRQSQNDSTDEGKDGVRVFRSKNQSHLFI